MNDVGDREPSEESPVRRAEAVAICVALVVLLIAFCGSRALSWLLPDGAHWVARAGTGVTGFWLATRAFRRALRSRGFEPGGLGVRLREGRTASKP